MWTELSDRRYKAPIWMIRRRLVTNSTMITSHACRVSRLEWWLTEGILYFHRWCRIWGLSGTGFIHRDYSELHLISRTHITVWVICAPDWLTGDFWPAWTVRSSLLDDIALDLCTAIIARRRPGELDGTSCDFLHFDISGSIRLTWQRKNSIQYPFVSWFRHMCSKKWTAS